MDETRNHPIIITFPLRSIPDHVNTNPAHMMINTIPGNPCPPRKQCYHSKATGWCPLAAPPLKPIRGGTHSQPCHLSTRKGGVYSQPPSQMGINPWHASLVLSLKCDVTSWHLTSHMNNTKICQFHTPWIDASYKTTFHVHNLSHKIQCTCINILGWTSHMKTTITG